MTPLLKPLVDWDRIPTTDFYGVPRYDKDGTLIYYHGGLDKGCWTGTVVRAAHDGVVTLKDWGKILWGMSVEIWHLDAANDIFTRYGHGIRWLVGHGTFVKAGTPILISGSTGNSSGAHLHFEARVASTGATFDPTPYLVDELEAPYVIRQPTLRLGQHTWHDRPGHMPGTPFVEVAWAFDPHDGHSLEEMGQRVGVLLGEGHRPLLRIDYQPGLTAPRDPPELTEFLERIRGFMDSFPNLNGIDVSFFNEPNLSAEGGLQAQWVAQCFNGFDAQNIPENNACAVTAGHWPHARTWIPATAAHGTNVEGRRGNPPGGEDSGWARYDYDLLRSIFEAQMESWAWPRKPFGRLVHSYSRPERAVDPASEPYEDIRHESGWRFGTNVLETWRENEEAAGFASIPVWISEWNSGASDDTPASNYVAGMLRNALDYADQVYGERLVAFCHFVGAHENAWREHSLQDPRGNMMVADEEYRALVKMGA